MLHPIGSTTTTMISLSLYCAASVASCLLRPLRENQMNGGQKEEADGMKEDAQRGRRKRNRGKRKEEERQGRYIRQFLYYIRCLSSYIIYISSIYVCTYIKREEPSSISFDRRLCYSLPVSSLFDVSSRAAKRSFVVLVSP
jgi:hypothetical protein